MLILTYLKKRASSRVLLKGLGKALSLLLQWVRRGYRHRELPRTTVYKRGSTAFFSPYNWNQLLFFLKSKLILTLKPENDLKHYSQEEYEVDSYFHLSLQLRVLEAFFTENPHASNMVPRADK